MKIATGLALIAVGAILTFAVTANTSVFNLHVAGVVIMLTGLAGLIMSRRQYDWLRRRMIILPRRRGKRTGAVVDVVEEPPYVVENPGTSRTDAGLPETPLIEPDPPRVHRGP